ncbi:MAG: L-threonine 3-dehydrogenase [Firmicutes bacterium]|nr:L-threonine 3-dehydrogenase [Bacillota bacterium]
MAMMKALQKRVAGPGLELCEVEVPSIRPDQVLVKIEMAAICGTDLHIYNWDAWSRNRVQPPRTVGHEFTGRIARLGQGVTGLREGMLVTAEGHFTCGKCYYCRTGQGHICDDVKILGVDVDGIFAEYAAIDAKNVWPLPENGDPAIGAIHDPLGNAVHAAYVHCLTGQNVVITGCGPIGLFCIALARQAGARHIFASDVNDYRIDLAEKLGADYVVNAEKEDLAATVHKVTGIGADILLEMSGSRQALASGLEALRKGAAVSLLGIFSDHVNMDLDEVIFNQLTLYGINGRRVFDTWFEMEAALDAGLDVSPVITHRFEFEQYEEAMALMNSGHCGKVLLIP